VSPKNGGSSRRGFNRRKIGGPRPEIVAVAGRSPYNPASTVRRFQKASPIMQGKQKVIDVLNAGLTIELTAINQYFVQAKMCRNWGLNKLADKHYHESIGEMKHAEKLIDRIIFLEGVPEIARYDVIRVGSTVEEQLQNDLELESKGVHAYNAAIQVCLDEVDGGSRDLLEGILVESEEHVDWLESQLDLISKIGIQHYMAQQIGEDAEGH
jgi:bacterioferritin